MVDLILWRRLTETDFNAIRAAAAPAGTGGGARHIALGRQSPALDVNRFLRARGRSQIAIRAEALDGSNRSPVPIHFRGNPRRRSGEWIIQDQYAHRHPAWSTQAGFPTTYSAANPPFVFVFRIGSQYFAHFETQAALRAMPHTGYLAGILARPSGVAPLTPQLRQSLGLERKSIYQTFQEQPPATINAFDPSSIEDGRRRILAEVHRRQGQPAFRNSLLQAYDGKCAITGCAVTEVLEAAHISPYRGRATNHIQNGLLLRADIHTLFDLGLISVDPNRRVIRVSSLITDALYTNLAGRRLAEPNDIASRPSTAALKQHHDGFHL